MQTAKNNSLDHLNNSFIYLALIGWEHCKPEHYFTGLRDMHLVHIVKSGKGTFEIAGNKYHLKANDMFYIPPNALATYCADKNEPWQYYYFAFNGAYSFELIQNSVFKNNNYVYKTEECETVTTIIEEASENIMSTKFPDIYGCEQLFKVLPYILHSKTGNENAHSKYISEAVSYIQMHYNQDISIKDITKFLNIDRSYFYRIFKEHFGISPIEYLINVRIDQSKKLLHVTNLSTNEIATIVGYKNYASFYMMFQKKAGLSPHEFRLLQIGEDSVSEKSLTTIRFFKTIDECDAFESYKFADLSPKDDEIYNGILFLNSRCYKLTLNSKFCSFFAYEFENEIDAKEYYYRATGVAGDDKSPNFKIKSNNTSTELTAMSKNCLFRLCGEDIETVNLFRRKVLNENFSYMIFH